MAAESALGWVKPPQPVTHGRALAQGWGAKFICPLSSSPAVFRSPQGLSQAGGFSLSTPLPLEGGVAPVGNRSAGAALWPQEGAVQRCRHLVLSCCQPQPIHGELSHPPAVLA